jgi:hypothetical protein
MAHHQVADGGYGTQIWRVAANVLNKHAQTANKSDPPMHRMGESLTTPHHKKPACYKI